jgi:hypothetical protein
VSLTQVGSDIRANILGADGRILENPIPVALARTPLGVAVEATVAGTDKSGRTILSTPFGVFLVNTGGAGAASLGQLIGQAPDAAARDIAHAVVLATSAGTLGAPTAPVLTNAPTGQTVPNPGREPDRVTFVLTALGAQLTATITGRDGLPLDHPIIVALALAEGEAQVPSARGLARLVPSLGPDQARAIVENLGTVWPALTKALESLNQISPDLMARIIERLPRAGPKLPAQLLAALSAIQSGEPSHLLTSSALDALRKAGQGGLVDDLTRDLNRMNTLAQQSNPDWRPVLLPFFDGQHLQQIALMIGRPPDHGAGDGDPGTRFVVGIDFAHLGAVQLDGFVEPDKRRFDLTIRSHQALDDEIKTGARTRFQSALEASRFAGRLFFQIGAPFPVAMPEGLGKPTVGLPPSWLRT